MPGELIMRVHHHPLDIDDDASDDDYFPDETESDSFGSDDDDGSYHSDHLLSRTRKCGIT